MASLAELARVPIRLPGRRTLLVHRVGRSEGLRRRGFCAKRYLVFGRETAGLPKELLQAAPERWLRIPMFNPQARSLNLSNCVALVLFEALRQQGFMMRDA